MENITDILRQAQEMQKKFGELMQQVEAMSVSGQSGGGMVSATATGGGQITGVKIDPQAVDPRDVGMLEDLVTAAVNDALAKAKTLREDELKKLTGGMGLPPGLI